MVKKEEIKTEDEIKEKENDETKEKEVEEKLEVTKEEKEIEKEIETSTSETGTIEEVELEDDPWSEENWKQTFPELYEKEITEKEEGLTEKDVIRIVREQLKLWLKGVSEGKYPLPKGMKPTEYPYPKKGDIEGLDEEFEKSKDLHKSYDEKFEDIAKTFEEIKKEVQIIKDSPVDLIEKEIKEKSDGKYQSPYKNLKDGTITIKHK